MKIIKIIFTVMVLNSAITHKSEIQDYILTNYTPSLIDSNSQEISITNESDFVELPPYQNSDSSKVVIIAPPQYCTKNSTRRSNKLAYQLAYQLKKKGIPVVCQHRIKFDRIECSDSTFIKRNYASVMNGNSPRVLIGGRGKSNPTLEEVVFEYYNNNF